MEIKVTTKAKGAVFDGRGPKIVEEKILGAMWEAVMFLEREVKKNTPQGVFGDQGGLHSTIAGEVEKGTTVIKGLVGHSKPYGEVIEKGRRAGKAIPPKGSLVRWMEVKLGMEKATAVKKEFVFRRKIGKKGFEGAHMFENALNNNWSRLQRIFDKNGFEIARELAQ